MLQLNPREYFTIARGLEDHTDSTTYYVRAVIRNAKTDALIETINLTDNGDRRFTYNWQVPADPSGMGFYIIVTSIVFTDSGYTTKAEMYGEKFETYLIAERNNPLLYGGGSGGADISYKKVRDIVREEVSKISSQVKPTEPDLSPLSDSLQAILTEVRGITIPEPKEVDLKPLTAKLDALDKAVKAIEIPKFKETDLTPLTEQISKIDFKDSVDAIKQAAEGIHKRLTTFMDIVDIKMEVKALKEKQDKMEDDEKEPVDYNSLLKQ